MAVEFRSTISNPIVASGVELLKGLFASPDSTGPVAYAMVADDSGEAALMKREAFQRVHELLVRPGNPKWAVQGTFLPSMVSY